jgi:hypothetical protein
MAEKEERPYFENSISQLEELFEQLKADPNSLRALDFELSFRTTNRAAKLRSKVAAILAAISIKPDTAVVADGGTSSTDHSTSAVAFSEKRGSRTDLTQGRPGPLKSTPVPVPIDPGELPSIPIPQNANQPAAILAAWTALEALSPQTYRRPEDLVAGDRSCVAGLSAARLPWEIGERSRPNRQLYYQISSARF